MAIHTTKSLIVARRRVTFGALVPYTIVPTTENGKIRLVMLLIILGGPPHIRAMTHSTISRKICGFMIRIRGRPVIRFMASKTVFGRASIHPTSMALGAITDLMPLGQGEKQVVGAPCRP